MVIRCGWPPDQPSWTQPWPPIQAPSSSPLALMSNPPVQAPSSTEPPARAPEPLVLAVCPILPSGPDAALCGGSVRDPTLRCCCVRTLSAWPYSQTPKCASFEALAFSLLFVCFSLLFVCYFQGFTMSLMTIALKPMDYCYLFAILNAISLLFVCLDWQTS